MGRRVVQANHLVPALANDLALREHLVREIRAVRQPSLLVTVDHGIACHAGVSAAKALGWKVLVTDHHLPGATLPVWRCRCRIRTPRI